MEAQQLILRRPVGCCLSLAASPSLASSHLSASQRLPFAPLTSYRAASTRRRTKKALKIPPHPSFLDKSASGSKVDTIIINPPSSAPSVHHTPFKFLPKEDPRRRANLASLFASARSTASTTISYNDPNLKALAAAAEAQAQAHDQDKGDVDAGLPPRFRGAEGLQPCKHHLTPADVATMRRLREEDPEVNSVLALSRRFKCSKLFVLMCCQASREHQKKHKARRSTAAERWGPRKYQAWEEKKKRMDMLFKGEL